MMPLTEHNAAMLRSFAFLFLVVAHVAVVLAADPIDYVKDVWPIFEAHCVACHVTGDAEGGLAMDSHKLLLIGGESGAVITPGAAVSSKLVGMVTGKADPSMPPEGEDPLDADQIAVLKTWIDQGAKGPDGAMPIKRKLDVPKIAVSPDVRLPVTAVAQSSRRGLQAVARFGSVGIRKLNQTVVSRIERLSAKVNSLQFSADGHQILLASGVTGAYGRAAIYDVDTGDLVREFLGHRDTLYCAVFSPDEKSIATAGYDRDIVLWDVSTGKKIHTLRGHNGAIFDLDFSPQGDVLVSACADETAKVWHVESGQRLDTLSQPEDEVWAVAITPDSKHIVAASADSRLRVWRLVSNRRAQINPLIVTRFVDESPLIKIALTSSGDRIVLLSEAGSLKVLDTTDWKQVSVLEPVGESGSDLVISADDSTVQVSLIDGRVLSRTLPPLKKSAKAKRSEQSPTFLKDQPLVQADEAVLTMKLGGESILDIQRFTIVDGSISEPSQVDHYRWRAAAGEVWAIDVDSIDKSLLDPIVTVLDRNEQPVLRTRLQAVRDTYFTFRGKNSSQANDFRLFAWQELNLNDYLYAAGEVTRLWMHPRGPDSGFDVYPGEGNRWTYFGTTHQTHALGEPAYVVRPLEASEQPLANGLPVFDVVYQNDDDPNRVAGKNSRLIFTAPSDDVYTLAITDTRGEGGLDYRYRLKVRAAVPSFAPSLVGISKPIHRGSGREFTVRIDRRDEFDGPVTFDLSQLPDGLVANTPLTIEPGQRYATGAIWASPAAEDFAADVNPKLTATAMINGSEIELDVGQIGKLTLADPPQTTCTICPLGDVVSESDAWTLSVERGQTVTARVVLNRKEGFDAEVSFGKEKSGRNATHGLYVDNIGLNGLLVLKNANEREFFLTADQKATPGKRSFFLTANVDGGVTSYPITVEVLP